MTTPLNRAIREMSKISLDIARDLEAARLYGGSAEDIAQLERVKAQLRQALDQMRHLRGDLLVRRPAEMRLVS
ncbi:hypothetical protein [Microvirga arsenatis]|uniref:Uncharacterized protein n=1 Tax=Microvirga arsenatis TaxID=2692265 RepID=A0ABW9Z1I3_9HYPH|nr:hypothetical protein [Microvirga arsenatis]NBJ13219.1 hypothetical protein [Microvirga arsenatis]NBJ25143.1 hypothetical protein [Microvirga arsenatis]